MKNKAGYQRILQSSDELRLCIAEWAAKATDSDKETLAASMVSLRYDLDELESGNYDASRLLAEPAAPSNTVHEPRRSEA